MIHTIYYEEAVQNHHKTQSLFERFPQAVKIPCQQYGEIFNRKSQHFRLQKSQPALILASKHDHFVLPAPKEYHIGAEHNYYFSHMLNCIYDCRYCFLQGMFRSAHYVLFVNYEDFTEQITKTINQHQDAVHFFSGYDCDSLALEPITGFVESILDLFEQHPHALLELRSKSTQIRCLLNRPALQNVVAAFSFTPTEVAQHLEHGVPKFEKRLQAMISLQKNHWPIGLRFDPLIYDERYEQYYKKLFEAIFSRLDVRSIHSISLGVFRMPKNFYHRIRRLYPGELPLANIDEKQGLVQYHEYLEEEMIDFCRTELQQYISADKLFIMG